MGTEMRGRQRQEVLAGMVQAEGWCVHRHGGGALLGELEGKPGYSVHRSPRKWELRHGWVETAEGF